MSLKATELLSDKMTEYEEKAFAARIADMVNLSERRGMVFSHFLNERQQLSAESELKRLRCENYCFFGGVENADRRILCVYSDYCCPEESDFPVSCITFKFKPVYKLSHRDFLGALTSLNLKRETIGDILTGEGMAQVFVADSVCPAVESEVRKIGSVGVTVSSDEPPSLTKEQSYREITGTLASLRLDCVLSLALRLSRSKVIPVISSGNVEVNYKPADNPSLALKEGDIFSARGFGKFRIKEISGISKKGRIHIVVLKYC